MQCFYLSKIITKIYILLAVLIPSVQFVYAEPVAKFAWTGSLTGLDQKTLEVPLGTVAMSEYVYVSTVLDNLTEKDPCSIMFIIDNSASNTSDKTDLTGERFKVVSELIDLIYKKAPETRVGLVLFGSRLWFYKNDDPNIFRTLKSTDAYIPPLELDAEYSGTYKTDIASIAPFTYTKKGIDVLKLYLETVTVPFMSTLETISKYESTDNIQYPFISHSSSLTNITLAFEGANHGHLNQDKPLNKSRHFNIFFSDGRAGVGSNNPDLNKVNDYIDGVDVPTTFTIFYNANDQDLVDLNTMTNNIKTNGYSNSNELSNIWNLTNWDDIKQTLTNDVFNKILSSSKGTPTEITIKTESETNWDSTGFKYKNLFPLQKNGTNFDVGLTIHIIRDSLDDLGDIINTIEKDTALSIEFDVAVKNITTPDSMIIRQWGRDLFMFSDDDTILKADSKMKEFELRFYSYKIDTIYGYKDISITVSSLFGNDKETINLVTGTDFSSAKFDFVVNGTATNNDGILNLAQDDSIIFIYENPRLPLDTIRKSIPFNDAVEYKIKSAVYFDTTANGHTDLVSIKIEGARFEDFSNEIYANILFSQTNITKQSFTVTNSGLDIRVATTGAEKTVTDINDIIFFKDTVLLVDGSKIVPSQVVATDSMAPIIMDAKFTLGDKKIIKDKLSIKFSEDIKLNTNIEQFNFCSNTGDVYRITCSIDKLTGVNAEYDIINYLDNREPKYGDSIWINPVAKITDLINTGNIQSNAKNIKRPLSLESTISILSACYKENDNFSDGLIDIIEIKLDRELTDDRAKSFFNNLILPNSRSFSKKSSYDYTNKILRISVFESGTPNTAIKDGSENLTINSFSVDSVNFYTQSIIINDSLAPVAINAIYSPGGQEGVNGKYTDTLKVTFSETISTFSTNTPFNFLDIAENIEYEMMLSLQTKSNSNRFTFIVTSSSKPFPQLNDSLWIDFTKNISDISNITQNSDNIKVPLLVYPYPYTYNVIVYPNPFQYNHFNQDMDKVSNKYLLAEDNDIDKNCIVIIALPKGRTPKNLNPTGNISLFDAVGNHVNSISDIKFNPKSGAVYAVWRDPNNSNGRRIGSSSLFFKLFIDDGNGKKLALHGMVGITSE